MFTISVKSSLFGASLALGLWAGSMTSAWSAPKPSVLGCPTSFAVQETSIADLQAALTSGQISSRCLVTIYLNRIALYDKQGPKINAILELNPQVLQIADQLDAERKAGLVRGPLHGDFD
jgi:amidase